MTPLCHSLCKVLDIPGCLMCFGRDYCVDIYCSWSNLQNAMSVWQKRQLTCKALMFISTIHWVFWCSLFFLTYNRCIHVVVFFLYCVKMISNSEIKRIKSSALRGCRWAVILKVIRHILCRVYISVSWFSSCLSKVQGRSCMVASITPRLCFFFSVFVLKYLSD